MYEFGRAAASVTAIPDGAELNTGILALWTARQWLNKMVGPETQLLSSSVRAASAVIAAINDIVPTDFEHAAQLDGAQALDWRLQVVKLAANSLATVLSNDMPDIASYVVSQKGIYRTEDLIAHAEQQMSASARAKLPGRACVDVREAGKCLAYEVPTACSFHLWRAVETVMWWQEGRNRRGLARR
jgi:hypothetical protein